MLRNPRFLGAAFAKCHSRRAAIAAPRFSYRKSFGYDYSRDYESVSTGITDRVSRVPGTGGRGNRVSPVYLDTHRPYAFATYLSEARRSQSCGTVPAAIVSDVKIIRQQLLSRRRKPERTSADNSLADGHRRITERG